MASVTIKRNHHWSDDWQPYLLAVNGVVKGNLYDNKNFSFDLPEGKHEICVRVGGWDKFKTIVEVKDKPLSLQIGVNNTIALQRYALYLILSIMILFQLDMRLELIFGIFLILVTVIHYFYSRHQLVHIHTV